MHKLDEYVRIAEAAEYLPEIIAKQSEATLTAQCIPTGDELHTLGGFPNFLAERRKLIADRLNRFLEDARNGQ